jgi:hypothetical protein
MQLSRSISQCVKSFSSVIYGGIISRLKVSLILTICHSTRAGSVMDSFFHQQYTRRRKPIKDQGPLVDKYQLVDLLEYSVSIQG